MSRRSKRIAEASARSLEEEDTSQDEQLMRKKAKLIEEIEKLSKGNAAIKKNIEETVEHADNCNEITFDLIREFDGLTKRYKSTSKDLMKMVEEERKEEEKTKGEQPPKTKMKCRRCTTVFENDYGKIPRVLACGHTLCENCVDNLIANGRITCPIDKRELETKNGFVKNYAIIEQNES